MLSAEHYSAHPAGASTIYLHDNLSEPPLSEVLADHIATGAVQYIWWNHTFESGGWSPSRGLALQNVGNQPDRFSGSLRAHCTAQPAGNQLGLLFCAHDLKTTRLLMSPQNQIMVRAWIGVTHHLISCPAGEYGKPPEFFNNPQMHSYEHCLQSYGPQHQFLGEFPACAGAAMSAKHQRMAWHGVT